MLEVNGIDVYYGDVQALWDVSFTVGQGEVVTLVGANGAGKTTAMRTVAGLLRPRRGTITLDGRPIHHLPPDQRVAMGIALVPEGRQLWHDMTVLENLEMGAYLPEARRHRAETLQEVFRLFPRLEERQRQKAGTLSGGERQMCAIGRALMSRPRILLLDEPSLGLAPLVVKEVFSAIRDINAQGVTVLLVEQNVHLALDLAHRAYVIETGRITLAGPARELKEDPRVKEHLLGV